MSSPLINQAALLLAHRRLRDLVDRLEARNRLTSYATSVVTNDVELTPVPHRPLDWQIERLARAALEILEGRTLPVRPNRDSPPAGPNIDLRPGQLGHGLNKFAMLGALGFDLPAYLDFFSPQGAWVSEVLHRGTPDPNRSRVVINTFELIRGTIDRTRANGDIDFVLQSRTAAFAMGMTCAMAAEIVMNPVLRGSAAEQGPRDWDRWRPSAALTGSHAAIVRNLMAGISADDYVGWLPSPSELSDRFLTAYRDALDFVIPEDGGLWGLHRPRGFPLFEERFSPGSRPSADDLRRAYRYLRYAMESGWGGWRWWGVYVLHIVPMFIVISATAGASWPAGLIFDDRAGAAVPGELGWSQLANLSMISSALGPLLSSIYFWAKLDESGWEMVQGPLAFVLRLVGLGLFVESVNSSWGPGGRWGLFAGLAAIDVYFVVRSIFAFLDNQPGLGIFFTFQYLPLAVTGLTLLVALIMRGMRMMQTTADGWAPFVIGVVFFALFFLVFIGAAVSVPLGDAGSPIQLLFGGRLERLPVLDRLPGGAAPSPVALARLFSDPSLWSETATPALSDLYYPSGIRPIVRIWWTGTGDLYVNHAHQRLQFRHDTAGPVTDVSLPPARLDPARLAAFLMTSVPGLSAEPVSPTAPSVPAIPLPYPSIIAGHGDREAGWVAAAEKAGTFVKLGTRHDDAYLLEHAPRDASTTTWGAGGPSALPFAGYKLVPGPGLGDTESTALGYAGDLAALLAMGAATHLGADPLRAPPAANLPDPLPPVYQVFRRWNLDERRVNEWRMLVAGGAASEKGTAPHRYDAATPHRSPPEPADAFNHNGERVASALGWVEAFRAWVRVAGNPSQDTDDPTAAPFTAPVARDAPPAPPTNRDLSDAMRFLFELG